MRKFLNNNNKVRLLVSVLISVILWTAMSYSPESEITTTITDIPISIVLPEQSIQDGLQVFGGYTTASVSVTGNRMTIGSLTASDIEIYAQQTNTVTSPGTYTFALSARKTGIKTGYEISSAVSPSVITVFVDRNSTLEMNITNNLHYQTYDNRYTSVTLSDDTVTIEGPETELNRIDKVAAESEIEGTLTSTRTINNIPLMLYDRYGHVIESDNITLSVSDVSATLLVLHQKEVPVELVFPGKPEGLDISDFAVISNPESVRVAGPYESLTNLNPLTVVGTDFSRLRNGIYTLELSIVLPSGCYNLSNQTVANVQVDLSSMDSKALEISSFEVSGLPENYNAEVITRSLSVRIYGPQEELDALTEDSITAEINIDPQMYGLGGSMELPVTVTISDKETSCWIYGSYTANVNITAIQ